LEFSWVHIFLGHPVLEQGSATYGTRVALGTPSNFQWHREAPRCTYHFYYNSHRR